MRVRKIRLDLFICMLIAMAIFAGIGYVGGKLGVVDKVIDAVGTALDGSRDVPDGEVGGYATDDTPRASTMKDLVELAENNQTFTIETEATKYLNYGTFVGEDYEWRVLKLDDDVAMAVKLNVDKIQDAEDSYDNILPVGRIIREEPGALDEMREMLSDGDVNFIVDAYIDMDGEANSTYISPNQQSAMMIAGVLMAGVPLLVFVLFMVTIFAIHAIFVKMGIFPPVFAKRES